MSDLISRQAAIDALWKAMYEYEDKTEKQFIESDDLDIEDWIQHRIFVQNMSDIDRQTILNLPSAQPERTDKHTETHACDCVSRQATIDVLNMDTSIIPFKKAREYADATIEEIRNRIEQLPSVQPTYTDADVQKIQDMEQAEIEKAFDLGREDAMAEIVRCKDCRWQKDQSGSTAWLPCRVLATPDDFYCGRAERRTDETD